MKVDLGVSVVLPGTFNGKYRIKSEGYKIRSFESLGK